MAPYRYLCDGQLTDCVPQPGTDRRLDAQGDKIMSRLVYRRIGDRESIVGVHSVNTAAGGGGVRWYEFRIDPERRVSLHQQGTYAPDGFFRWMASPAIDARGNIGIGYSFGGTPHFAGQRFAARLADDPPGRLTLREAVLVEGEASQAAMRWEDYTQTAMDPVDDCTIWYVGDYLKNGATAYSTRIGAFRMPGCPAQEAARAPSPPRPPAPPAEPTPADILRGAYGPYRSNNDLLSYDLDVRVDPVKKSISGTNTIRFRMLKDASRIQLDLTAALNVDGITLGGRDLQYEREFGAVLVDFPERLKKGRVYEVAFRYSGTPPQSGRFGGIAFRTDPAGRPWINTACQHIGASVWWPNKDQYRDEVEEMHLRVAVPSDLVDVSNGKFLGKTDLGDGYTRWDWHIQYPINNYSVSLNIGHYTHFTDEVDGQTLDFYCLPENLDKARTQFAQATTMMRAFQKYFGPYPFPKDGYKLIEVPYSGMEHQSAVTYGNRFANGYLERDWTGRRHQHEVRLHHRPRERPRVVRERRHGERRVRRVDSRGLGHLGRGGLRRTRVRQGRRAEVPQRVPEQRSGTVIRSCRRAESTACRPRTCISRAPSSSTRCDPWWTMTRGGGAWWARSSTGSSTGPSRQPTSCGSSTRRPAGT